MTMTNDNYADGHVAYSTGDTETRDWFQRQWAAWPERVDDRYTTNMTFHRGAIAAFREETGREATMSADLAANIRYFDRKGK